MHWQTLVLYVVTNTLSMSDWINGMQGRQVVCRSYFEGVVAACSGDSTFCPQGADCPEPTDCESAEFFLGELRHSFIVMTDIPLCFAPGTLLITHQPYSHCSAIDTPQIGPPLVAGGLSGGAIAVVIIVITPTVVQYHVSRYWRRNNCPISFYIYSMRRYNISHATSNHCCKPFRLKCKQGS